jgi:tetratricopeptide (TPR) repeat protein
VLDVYHEILTLDPNSAEAYMLAGEALDGERDRAGAIQQFRAAVQANPKEPNVHLYLGYLLWVQSQYPESAAEFQAELNNDPNNAEAMAYLADAKVHTNQFEAAQVLLEKAVQIAPGNELVHLDLGIVYSDGGRHDEALRELKLAEQLDPSDVKVYWRLGHLYQIAGMKDEAKAEFDKLHTLKDAQEKSLNQKLLEAQEKSKRGAGKPSAPDAR